MDDASTTCPKCGNIHNSYAESGKLIPRCPSCYYSYFGAPTLKNASPASQVTENGFSIKIKIIPKKEILITSLLIITTLSAYSFISPTLDMNNFRRALFTGTASEISDYVDYEKLKFNIKSRLKAEMAENARSLTGTPFASLAQSVANTAMDKMIDAIISPYGLKIKTKSWNNNNAEKNHYFKFIYHDFNHARIIVSDSDWIEMERHGLFSWKIVDMIFPHI